MIAKWTTNSKMKKVFEKVYSHPSLEELELNIGLQQLEKLFFPPFRQVKDCIIISEIKSEELEQYFDTAIKIHMDKTGYEASNTETRINCYFENEISMVAGTKIALMVIDVWALKLRQMDPSAKFCFILCSDESCVEIRFHKVREDENSWLDEELEHYEDGAVGYVII